MIFRTHKLDQLNEGLIDKEVVLSAWIYRKRDLGGMVFIDLRDRYGQAQLVFDPNILKNFDILSDIKQESVIRVEGVVRKRPEDMINKSNESGSIEVLVKKFEVLSESQVLPFEIDQDKNISEDIRLKYRFLDLRKDRMRKNIIFRSHFIKYIRDLFCNEGFLEIETPILLKGTPEGSREYIVPSRLYPCKFYVLPQSPQQLKQLLMVSGFDKYFQLARCFRDEDQRGDRQPEFTQVDIEMSFVESKEIMEINEKIMLELVKKFLPNKKLQYNPFLVLSYNEVMNRFGSDKPDLRFELELKDLTEVFKECGFKVFENIIESGGIIKSIKIDNGASFSRKEIDDLEEEVKKLGAKGLSYLQFVNNEFKGNIVKFLDEKVLAQIKDKLDVEEGDLILIGAGEFEECVTFMGHLRLILGNKLNLIDNNLLSFLWVNDFPLFEKDKDSGLLVSKHHPFTSPKNPEDLDKDSENAIADAYDLILNGNEIAGGSVRIYDNKLQKKVFTLLGLSDEDIDARFGHLLNAFNYGVPPHAGIAWGVDRLIMLFLDEINIREVIAFPKDQKARDLMLGSPTTLPDEALKEANIIPVMDK